MKPAFSKTHARRSKLVEHARNLARSGDHADHASILRELERIEDIDVAREALASPLIRLQLDRLCALAQLTADARRNVLGARGSGSKNSLSCIRRG